MSQLRKIERNLEKQDEAEAAAPEVPDNHLKLPVGKMLTDPIKGTFLALPLLGYVSRRAKDHTPLLLLSMLLMDPEFSQGKGTLLIEIPVFEGENEDDVIAALDRFGWDGRVWPQEGDEGWPTFDETWRPLIESLLGDSNLRMTLVFPPGEKGTGAQEVTVAKARGSFLMPPLPKAETEVTPEKREAFRALWNLSWLR